MHIVHLKIFGLRGVRSADVALSCHAVFGWLQQQRQGHYQSWPLRCFSGAIGW
jgi:hypothetical protein